MRPRNAASKLTNKAFDDRCSARYVPAINTVRLGLHKVPTADIHLEPSDENLSRHRYQRKHALEESEDLDDVPTDSNEDITAHID